MASQQGFLDWVPTTLPTTRLKTWYEAYNGGVSDNVLPLVVIHGGPGQYEQIASEAR